MASASEESAEPLTEAEEEKLQAQAIFRDECAKDKEWKKKYIHGSMYLLGAGAYGSVFQVTTRTYPVGPKVETKMKYQYEPAFVKLLTHIKRVNKEQQEKLIDKNRHDQLLDVVGMKFELLDRKLLDDGNIQNNMFLYREFEAMRQLWGRSYQQMTGFPILFDGGFMGNKTEYGINPKYKDIFMIYNMRGEDVNFFDLENAPDIKDVTTIRYLTMELLGPSLEDLRNYFQPWFEKAGMNPYFSVRTTFMICDQFLCRLAVLHGRGFVHHDLKLDNIALGLGRSMNTVYLLDFGFCKKVSDLKQLEWMGSRKFMSVDTYDKERPNFSQDLESWFYIFIALLYDRMPWADEFIADMLPKDAKEEAKWEAAMSVKRTWWADPSEASSLRELIGSIEVIHRAEVADIGDLVRQVYRQVRDLRSSLKQFDHSSSMITEVSNQQSATFRSYMSIRKVLLSIFRLDAMKNNKLLWDAEYESMLKRREENGSQTFHWNELDFEWEWDCLHDKMFPESCRSDNNKRRVSKPQVEPLVNLNARLSSLLMARRSRKPKPDEISYAYDSRTDSLQPKGFPGLPTLPFRRESLAQR